MRSGWFSIAMLLVLLGAVGGSPATADDDVRAFVDRFVAAQNAHDLAAVGELLWDRRSSCGSPAAPRSGAASRH